MVIFTDLDGTLLDHTTYSFEPAREALRLLHDNRLPLILCSSKTRAELEVWRQKLDVADPFVAENGGAVFIPEGIFPFVPDDSVQIGRYRVLELGVRYGRLRRVFAEVRRETCLPLVGFGDLDVEGIMAQTGLSRESSQLAREREYDEPFYAQRPLTDAEDRQLETAVHRYGLRLTRGGRFYHLIGSSDKGQAVRILIILYARALGRLPRTVALGDSVNDLPMLEVVDVPVLVRKPGDEYDADVLKTIEPRLAPGIGPSGWNRAILDLLRGE